MAKDALARSSTLASDSAEVEANLRVFSDVIVGLYYLKQGGQFKLICKYFIRHHKLKNIRFIAS